MEIKKSRFTSDVVERKEKIEATLARLQSLKFKVSELRLQLETLREQQSERQEKAFLCNHCGKAIRKGTEIMIKGFNGEVKKSYHGGCFKAVLSS
jgi:chromosome segregation ATPase